MYFIETLLNKYDSLKKPRMECSPELVCRLLAPCHRKKKVSRMDGRRTKKVIPKCLPCQRQATQKVDITKKLHLFVT